MLDDLKILEQRWSMALRSAGFGVWDLDPRREQVHYSPEWKALLGYDSADEPDSTATWRERVHPDDLQPMIEALFAHLDGRHAVYEKEFRLRAADGSYRWVLSCGRVFERNDQGEAVRVIGTLTDLTDRREAEALRAERDRAEAASRDKTEFLSRMSHELRTPLNAVIGLAQIMSAGIGSTDVRIQREYTEEIEKAGWHLLGMIDDVLDLSRIQSGHLELRVEPVPLALLLRTAHERVLPLAREHGIVVRLGALPVDAMVPVDAARLEQAIGNLLSNAVKYNRAGGTVDLEVAPGQGTWLVSVSDSGAGISAEQQVHLFEPFNRLGREKSFVGGVGVGLVLSRWLLLEMGASLAVHSTEGVGSRFEVTLPALVGDLPG